MLRHNLLLIYRNFRRFRTTFFINLIGLSSGIAAAIFIYLWVADELSMDKFHKKDRQLFQVMTNQNRPDGVVTLGSGPALLEDALPAEMPEIQYTVGSSGVTDFMTLSVPGKNISAAGQFAGVHFFKVFSYPLLKGDKEQVLADKKSIVISERMARALFNSTENVIGKMVEWQVPGYKEEALVSGIFRNIPRNSSVQFDFLLPYDLYEDFMREFKTLTWGNHNAITYLLLKENTNLANFNAKIENFVKEREPGSNLTLFAKPYSENYLYGTYENGKLAGGRITYVRLFSAIAIFILLIACINFMNLATAKASRRIKEVGIKKAMGAARKTLALQYLGESILMSLLSMAIAILMVDLLLPQFNSITGKHLFIPADGDLILVVTAITLFTGFVAGSYPALYLSGFNPAQVLKGKFYNPDGEQWARKGLFIFQFALAVVFIVSVWVTYKQMEYVQTKHLGFDKNHVIYFQMEGNLPEKLDPFLHEIEGIPGVLAASGIRGNVMGATSFTTGSFNWKGRDPDVVVQFEHLGIHYGMIELLGIEMSAGRSFSRDYPSDSLGIIFNETAIATMGLDDPVGEIFNLWGKDYTIIGVTKDFHFESLHQEVKPFFFRLTPKDYNRVMVRIDADNQKETLQNIQSFYQSFNPGYALDYTFLDADYQAQYAAEQRVATLSKYFAALAIIISCLGLFGLASFTAERRLKEIGIRKVLGSSVFGIVYLLSGDFTKIVLMAVVFALPLSYVAITRWLSSFAYRVELEWWYFAGAGFIALGIAWLTVGIQAFKAARLNPVKCLRDE